MKKLAYLFILFLCVSSCERKTETSVCQQDVCGLLKTVSVEDFQILDSFFQLLLKDYDFAYSLFGSKPMSMAYYPAYVNAWSLHHPSQFLIFHSGWERWESYCSHFPSQSFVLKRCRENEDYIGIFLINKKEVFRAIAENISLFQEVLGEGVQPNQLLEQICCSEKSIMQILHNHSGLLGILLGYGKDNAMAFERKTNICKELNSKMTPPFSALDAVQALETQSRCFVDLYIDKAFTFPSSIKGDSIAEELNELIAREFAFELLGSNFFLDRFVAPTFIAQEGSAETEHLRQQYELAREKIQLVYRQQSFLEATLNQWINPQ